MLSAAATHNLFNTRQTFDLANGQRGTFYALQQLEVAQLGKISRLPVSLRIILESVLRHYDGKKITEAHIRQLAGWQPNASRTEEIPFIVARILLQDFTGVPLLVDLAAMRVTAHQQGKDPKMIEPMVPVDLVVDHSVQVDFYNDPEALKLNMTLEYARNAERYKFLKWGMQAFHKFNVVPPGVGIVHQVNLEYLAKGLQHNNDVYYPDTLVGTDSHTTMINSLGVVGWGVGGIEAEAGMLGQPNYFLTPDVVGMHLTGQLREGVTATDLVLTITELLRQQKVVGKFVEFFGTGTAALTLPDRATIANMAPEYGATVGFFPIDEHTAAYLRNTGRTDEDVDNFIAYFKAQHLFGIPQEGEIDYSSVISLDLNQIEPSLAGPKRPQDRVPLSRMRETFNTLFSLPIAENGFNRPSAELAKRYSTGLITHQSTPHNLTTIVDIGHGDVLIAAITSCTNTSNPTVLLMAGLLAKKAIERGLHVKPHIKTSLAPGSRVVTRYLTSSGLLPYLEQLGFGLVGYGCTTCIGNSGPLEMHIEETLLTNDVIGASVLSGNRNFEARIHPNIKANYLASPPLVVAYALAGRININLDVEALGVDQAGHSVYLRDIWPSNEEVQAVKHHTKDPDVYRKQYANLTEDLPLWNDIKSSTGDLYPWENSTYIAQPPYFARYGQPASLTTNIQNAKALAVFGDSVTTDHISPAGNINVSSPAGQYLRSAGVASKDFNSYGSRRGNHEVMIRGTFANVRIKNLLLPIQTDGSRKVGGLTVCDEHEMTIYAAAMSYIAAGTPTLIFAGEEYGTGSSRDWAAKGTKLLGVKAVIAKSFERIHRSNLVGMGVLPLQFKAIADADALQLTGEEHFDITGLEQNITPLQDVWLTIYQHGEVQKIPLLLRIDTPIEVEYYRHDGILPYVLQTLLA